MRKLGRIIVREKKLIGLFFPLGDGLEEGIYEIREILDELVVVRIGKSAMNSRFLNAYDLNGLEMRKWDVALTAEELKEVCDKEKEAKEKSLI
jgi:hypothetical protein